MKKCLLVGAVIIGMFMYGCSVKDDTIEAKIEEAKIALDDRNYNKAIDILSPLLDKDGDGDFDDDDVPSLTAGDSDLAQLLAFAEEVGVFAGQRDDRRHVFMISFGL